MRAQRMRRRSLSAEGRKREHEAKRAGKFAWLLFLCPSLSLSRVRSLLRALGVRVCLLGVFCLVLVSGCSVFGLLFDVVYQFLYTFSVGGYPPEPRGGV